MKIIIRKAGRFLGRGLGDLACRADQFVAKFDESFLKLFILLFFTINLIAALITLLALLSLHTFGLLPMFRMSWGTVVFQYAMLLPDIILLLFCVYCASDTINAIGSLWKRRSQS